MNTKLHAVIGNIPPDYHSSDLRNFFSQFIETKGFDCFHFRHRPEGKDASQTTKSDDSVAEPEGKRSLAKKKKTCCIVRLSEQKYKQLVQLYHKRHWLNKKGESIPSLCFISTIKVSNRQNISERYPSRADAASSSNRESQEFTQQDLAKLPELCPPAVMPNGNVGTPTLVFLKLIQACRLPPKIIAKLGLSFPKTRSNRKYGNVGFDYHTHDSETVESNHGNSGGDSDTTQLDGNLNGEEESVDDDDDDNCQIPQETQSEKKADRGQGNKKGPTRLKKNRAENTKEDDEEQKSGEDDDDDDCEEWERHEALHDDPANYERNKERVFEEPMEVVWEKGGPGLVWYTDECYWRQQDGDFDEQTTDDWDVDMGVYYDPTGGDRDAMELLTMRREQKRRRGYHDDDDDEPPNVKNIGSFEKYTKGIGRRVLQQQGWEEGAGLGSSVEGISNALDNDGQKPTDKSGFGYRGEKLSIYRGRPSTSTITKPRKRTKPEDVIIPTAYDKPEDLELPETVFRRTDHNTMKYRDGVRFWKGKGAYKDNS